MAHFVKGPAYRTPFGKNVYRGSVEDASIESYTFAASTCPSVTIDGATGQKVLQPGTLVAKISVGGEAGKIGPYEAAASDGRQSASAIVGFTDTFLPYQLMDRDVEVGVLYRGVVTQANCFEITAGAFAALSNATTALVKVQVPGVIYRKASTEL